MNEDDITTNYGYDELVMCPLCRHKTFKGDYNHEVFVNKDNELDCSGISLAKTRNIA